MRSKMLGLAIALSTFGLGVAATTSWIAYHTPNVPVRGTLVATRTELVAVPAEGISVGTGGPAFQPKANDTACRCDLTSQKNLTIIGGNLNKRGLPGESPAPPFPPIARAAQASGTVAVQVLVDECGNVISARAASGHPLLQQAAVQTAYKWHFPPGLVGGEPAKVKGILTFNFLLQ